MVTGKIWLAKTEAFNQETECIICKADFDWKLYSYIGYKKWNTCLLRKKRAYNQIQLMASNGTVENQEGCGGQPLLRQLEEQIVEAAKGLL